MNFSLSSSTLITTSSFFFNPLNEINKMINHRGHFPCIHEMKYTWTWCHFMKQPFPIFLNQDFLFLFPFIQRNVQYIIKIWRLRWALSSTQVHECWRTLGSKLFKAIHIFGYFLSWRRGGGGLKHNNCISRHLCFLTVNRTQNFLLVSPYFLR